MTPCCGGYTGFGLQPFTQPRSPSGVKTRSALSALASSSNDPSRTTCLVVILLSGNLVCDAETITTPPTANNIAIQFIAPPKEKPPGPMRRQAVHLQKNLAGQCQVWLNLGYLRPQNRSSTHIGMLRLHH